MGAGQKAAVTALVGCYYVVRMGAPNCTSPLPGYGPSPSGDEWPGGCVGKWTGADRVKTTLHALRSAHSHPGLLPGSLRVVLPLASGGKGAYAALRYQATAAGTKQGVVIVFNFSHRPSNITIDIQRTLIASGQSTVDLIQGGMGPPVRPHATSWVVSVEGHGWKAIAVTLV